MSRFLDRAVDAVIRIDLKQNIKFISENGSQWFNSSLEHANKHFLKLLHVDDVTIFSQLLELKQESFSCEVRVMKDSSDVWVSLRCFFMETIQQYVICLIDISKWRLDTDHLKKMTEQDSLTKLANRVYLEKLVNEYFSIKLENFSIAMLDLDGFKKVNDTFGHPAGDLILIETARRLKKTIGKHHLAVRLGGDEFVILFSPVEEKVKQSILKRVLQCIARPYDFEGHEVYIGASIGIADYPQHGSTYSALLKNADTAMYRSKTNGKNQITTFVETVEENNVTINNALRRAISEGEFYLVYQPQFSIDGDLVGLEALMRWNSSLFGHIGPDRFIPIAEETGLMSFLGKWALRSACWQLKHFQIKRPELTVSVNVSASQFKNEDFCDIILDVLHESGVSPDSLILEITESVLIVEYEKIIKILNQLKTQRVQMSIDDFGTGFSSLAYLKYLPVSHLKIDKTFVKTMVDDRDRNLVRTIIDLAHGLNLSCTAEGVETNEQFNFLKEHHCDFIQGYLFGKPMPCEAIDLLLDTA